MKVTIWVRIVRWTHGMIEDRWIDGMEGHTVEHALSRAKENWPGCSISIRWTQKGSRPLP